LEVKAMPEEQQKMNAILIDAIDKLKKQIIDLDCVLKQDTNEKDKQYHKQASMNFKKKLRINIQN
jgi:hypothetical protein